jgi:hypothetical protein
MIAETQRIDRVTADLGPSDWLSMHDPSMLPSFYLVPSRLVADFDHITGEWISVTITGQRYRAMSNGPDRPTGPRGNTADTRAKTVWTITRKTDEGWVRKLPAEIEPLMGRMSASRP